MYEASLNEHGIPRHLAEDPERRFAVDEVVDHAAAAMEEAREEYKRGDNVSHGLRLVVVDQGVRKKPDAPR